MNDQRTSPHPFGIFEFLSWDHPWNRRHNTGNRMNQSVAAMKEAGAGIVRFDFLWADIEPVQGRFEFARYDRIVDCLEENQLKALGILAYTPPWLNPDWRAAPDARRYCQYARAVIRRYKDRIQHWEIWHEPDSDRFWRPQDKLRTYSDLLRQVYSELKHEDPTCLVHLGGLSNALPGSLKQTYERGAREWFDKVHCHAFANPLSPHALRGLHALYEEMRQIMTLYGDQDKEIWLTQIGCPGMQNPQASSAWWLGANLTEEKQAAWLAEAMTDALTWPGVTKVFWSFLRDTDRHFNSGGDCFGLLRQNFSKKPAFKIYQKIAASWKLAAESCR